MGLNDNVRDNSGYHECLIPVRMLSKHCIWPIYVVSAFDITRWPLNLQKFIQKGIIVFRIAICMLWEQTVYSHNQFKLLDVKVNCTAEEVASVAQS